MTTLKHIGFLILSFVLVLLSSLLSFYLDNTNPNFGFPLSFSSFNFLGSGTDYLSLLLDVLFWFLVIKVLSKLLSKLWKH